VSLDFGFQLLINGQPLWSSGRTSRRLTWGLLTSRLPRAARGSSRRLEPAPTDLLGPAPEMVLRLQVVPLRGQFVCVGQRRSPWHDHNPPEFTLSAAGGDHRRMVLQGHVDDTSVPGVHRTERDFPTRTRNTIRSPARQGFKRRYPALTITGNVHLDPNRRPQAAGGHCCCQRLQSRQRLPVFSDQAGQILSLDRYPYDP